MKDQIIQLIQPYIELPENELINLIETPPTRDKGDIAFPCFQLAKTMRKAPHLIAEDLVTHIQKEDLSMYGFSKVEQVGPYVNFFFDRQRISFDLVTSQIDEQLSNHQIGQNKTIVVEYSSPNIAKHFKLYHIRSTMIGQALANTYAALGYNVEKINHIGDWGTQFGKLMAAYHKWGNDEKIKADPISELVTLYVRFHEEAEKKPALEDEGRLWFKKLEAGDPEAVRLWQWFKDESMQEFTKIYELLGVTFDHQIGESYYGDKMKEVIQQLKEKNLLEESDGALIVRLDEQDIAPCLITKSDGTSIYATRDLAAAIYREENFHPQKILYVVDQRQALHFQQVFSVLKKMDYAFADGCQHISFGIMKINGEIGSTRQGKGLLLHEVLEHAIKKAGQVIEEKNITLHNKDQIAKAIGTGALIFNDLKHHRAHDVNFNWDEAFNFEGKTGPYVQYTHARIRSMLRRAEHDNINLNANTTSDDLQQNPLFAKDLMWDLMYTLYKYPTMLVETTKKEDPSQIAAYLLDLCQLFNRFYAQERIFTDNAEETRVKLLVCQKIAQVLKHGLQMLTIQAPDEI